MKAPAFQYLKANSLEEVFALFERHGDDARLLAGGQSLLPAMNVRLAEPQVLIDINDIDDLSGISLNQSILRIGAMTRHAEVETSDLVARHAPLLQTAIKHVAHPGIRNRGTIGGSVVNADPASEYPACLLALDAVINLASCRGTRSIPVEDFFIGVYETNIEEDEILVSIDVPAAVTQEVFGFTELTRRTGDYATAGMAGRAVKTDAGLSGVRLAFFGVSGQPVLARSAAKCVEGRQLTPEIVKQAQEALADDLEYLPDLHNSVEMKAHLSRVIFGRVLQNMASEDAS